MDRDPQLILVDANILPNVYLKVLEAKKLLSKGIAKNSSEACKMADISRSAFYKYKDGVFNYEEKQMKKTLTLYLRLNDEPGVLSAVLAVLHRRNANVLTVNQNIPVDGVADVTITIRINEKNTNIGQLRQDFKTLSGVVECKKI
jgi:chorismate mutase